MVQRALVELLSDSETGLLNGHYFELRVEEELKKSRRFGWPVTLVRLDIDGLGELPDLEARSAALDVAGIVLTHSRDVDLSARLTRERFGIVLPGTDAAGARVMVGRVMGEVIEKLGDRLTLSVGLSDAPRPDLETADEWRARAETAVRTARSQGGNQMATWNARAGV